MSGEPILGRLIDNLRVQGITRLIVVTGYLDHCIKAFLEENAADMQLDYVFNPVFKTTNNIYSLWLARKVIEEPFVLVESDLVFEESMLAPMLMPDKIAVSNTLPWMNGTVVELNADKRVKAFHVSHNVNDARQYKTVNITSLSLHSWQKVVERLGRYIEEGRVDEYYETAFAAMVADGSLELEAVFFDQNKWYEIDCVKDLHQAELMFPRVSPLGLPETLRTSRVTSRSVDNVVSLNKLLLEKNS